MDSAVRQLLWHGAIPLEIHLDDPETLLTTSTLPFYMMVRRMLYFPMLVNEIKRHFGSISRSSDNEKAIEHESPSSLKCSKNIHDTESGTEHHQNTCWWFTCKLNDETMVIPLHLPIGLLFDLIQVVDNKNASVLPLKLEFHISTTKSSPAVNHNNNNTNINSLFPIEHYTAIPDESALSSLYFSSLKESDHLRSGSAKNVMNLSRAEQLQLWESLRSGECEKFCRINQKLLGGGVVKSVPIKFWIYKEKSLNRFQFPVPYTNPAKTLQELLNEEFTNLQFTTVWLHGIEVPLQITLEELNYNWNYADNFINLLLVIK